MEELALNKETRSDRKWSWTNRNEARAADILHVADELRRWWPLTARQIYYRLISSGAVKLDHWYWKGKQVGHSANTEMDAHTRQACLGCYH